MFYSPFSQPTEYISPDGKGIYLKPFSSAAPNGWGEPRIDENGQPIKPGTPGGPLPNVLINKQKGLYKASANKYHQMSGNITWWGDWRNEMQQAKGKHVLSYKGPKLRYFKENGFSYGSDNSHNEIYYMGNYAGVAPGPVLGAGMKKALYYNPPTQTTKESTFLYVICYKNGKEIVYRRRWDFAIITPSGMNDAVRQQAMSLFDMYENPTGWEAIATILKQPDTYAPETPWFFNKSCTAAATVRRKTITFHNGFEDVTEDMFDRYTLSIGVDRATFDNLGNNLPYQYEERTRRVHPDIYFWVDYGGHTHAWQEDHLHVDIKLTGSQYVMVDYIGDEIRWGKVVYNIDRGQSVYYTFGIDDLDILPPPYCPLSNWEWELGPRYFDAIIHSYTWPNYVAEEGNHEFTRWIRNNENVYLAFGPEGQEDSTNVLLHRFELGTSDEWAGNPFQENNPYYYYYQYYDFLFRGFFDIRYLAFFLLFVNRYGLWQDTQNQTTVNRTLKMKDGLFVGATLTTKEYGSYKETDNKIVEFGWTRAQMLAVVDTESVTPEHVDKTLIRTTYTGGWPDDNFNGEVQLPGSKTFYQFDQSGDIEASWPTIENLLFGTYNNCKGNGVVTERSEVGFSVEVPDPEVEGKFVIISDMVPAGIPEDVVGYGTKFYPVGAC